MDKSRNVRLRGIRARNNFGPNSLDILKEYLSSGLQWVRDKNLKIKHLLPKYRFHGYFGGSGC